MLEPPPVVLDIYDKLERAGYDTWCVGGAVRDALLGLPNADWDLATAATPQEVMRLFRRHVPLGVEHGTVGVLDRHNVAHEVTTFRRDVETDGRHAVVKFGATLDEDLARRDFTINAIAYKPRSDEIRDPFEGRADLARGVVRAVGNPSDRMREDRLRALRAFRFAARFEFTIDADTWSAIVASVPDLPHLSAERVAQELEKTMQQVRRPSLALERWRVSGALPELIPAFREVSNANLKVTITSLDCLPLPHGPRRDARKSNRLAALFWDFDHDMALRAALDLRFSRQRATWIADLADSWFWHGAEIEASLLTWDATQVRLWVSRIGRTKNVAFWRIASARWAAARVLGKPAPPANLVRSVYRTSVHTAFHDPVEIGKLAIDGSDLLFLGIPPGPRIGQILKSLLDEVLVDPSRNTREYLLDRAQRMTEP